jgi:hypothetical protein
MDILYVFDLGAEKKDELPEKHQNPSFSLKNTFGDSKKRMRRIYREFYFFKWRDFDY